MSFVNEYGKQHPFLLRETEVAFESASRGAATDQDGGKPVLEFATPLLGVCGNIDLFFKPLLLRTRFFPRRLVAGRHHPFLCRNSDLNRIRLGVQFGIPLQSKPQDIPDRLGRTHPDRRVGGNLAVYFNNFYYQKLFIKLH